jgi:hypothetical protein
VGHAGERIGHPDAAVGRVESLENAMGKERPIMSLWGNIQEGRLGRRLDETFREHLARLPDLVSAEGDVSLRWRRDGVVVGLIHDRTLQEVDIPSGAT